LVERLGQEIREWTGPGLVNDGLIEGLAQAQEPQLGDGLFMRQKNHQIRFGQAQSLVDVLGGG
jgi:hypothetical protein